MSVIQFQNVSLSYPIYDADHRSLKGKISKALNIGGTLFVESRSITKVTALTDVSLYFDAGDTVAVLGRNGAGKSTLLRLMAGIYQPQSGQIEVNGRVSSMFNIRLGLDQTATGYENIRISGMLQGLSLEQIESRYHDIAEFSELGEFLNLPIRTYSQGMAMRLAFAISTSIDPDILLLDEWIGAGDQQFLEKAQIRLRELTARARLVVVATHRIALVKSLCNKAVLLENGRVKASGPVPKVLREYASFT